MCKFTINTQSAFFPIILSGKYNFVNKYLYTEGLWVLNLLKNVAFFLTGDELLNVRVYMFKQCEQKAERSAACPASAC